MSTSAAVVPVALAAVIAAVVVLARGEIRSPVVGLLRVLVPSWRFFDAVSEPPALTARVITPDGDAGPWRTVLPAPRRAWWNVAWHPDGNVSFACHSLLYRLREDLSWCGDDDRVDDLVTYHLVLDLVRWRLRDRRAAGTCVQFRLAEPFDGGLVLIESEAHAL